MVTIYFSGFLKYLYLCIYCLETVAAKNHIIRCHLSLSLSVYIYIKDVSKNVWILLPVTFFQKRMVQLDPTQVIPSTL